METNTRNDLSEGQVQHLISAKSRVSYLLTPVNSVLSDETGEETNPSKDISRQAEFLTILDVPKEVKMGRLKEVNSLKEIGVMTAAERSEASRKRVIQTRWVDGEKDGCLKSWLVLKDFNRDHGRTQLEQGHWSS